LTELTFQVAIRTLRTTVHCRPASLGDNRRLARSVIRVQRSIRRLPSRSYEVPRSAAVLAVGLILAADPLKPESHRPVWLDGLLDEAGHLATGVITLGVLGARVDARIARALLGASVLIDLDHIPQYTGADWLTAGTARPYPHSSLTLLAASATFWALRRRAPQAACTRTALGVLLGLSGHFVRDLAEPRVGVPLLWPFSNRAVSIPRRLYVALVAAGAVRRVTA
jgi:membrane-bound metal-dependent hydrolase YbcI (DUF457 family)